jgi:hypothetical protein
MNILFLGTRSCRKTSELFIGKKQQLNCMLWTPDNTVRYCRTTLRREVFAHNMASKLNLFSRINRVVGSFPKEYYSITSQDCALRPSCRIHAPWRLTTSSTKWLKLDRNLETWDTRLTLSVSRYWLPSNSVNYCSLNNSDIGLKLNLSHIDSVNAGRKFSKSRGTVLYSVALSYNDLSSRSNG